VRSTPIPSECASSTILSYGAQFTAGYDAGSEATNPCGAVRARACGAICAHTTMIRTIWTPSARNVLIVPAGLLSIRVESSMIDT